MNVEMSYRKQNALEVLTAMSEVEHYLQESASDAASGVAQTDRIRLDLTPQELCLLLACISKYVTTESVRLQDRPEMRERLLEDAMALLRKATAAMPLGEDADD